MNHKGRTITLMLLLTLLLGVSGTMAQDPQPAGEVSITAVVDSKFSYQGLLEEGGSPVTGSRHMTFRLYADAACTSQVGSDIDMPAVPVADGLFSVMLDVAPADVTGQGLWLEVEVLGTPVVCHEIVPVPYALSLRPGAVISGDGTALVAYSSDRYALWAETAATDNYYFAVRGSATGTTGVTYGVGGTTASNSDGAVGVVGRAYATSGHTYGVWGRSESTSGTGIQGHAAATSGVTYGVEGRSDSSDDNAAGVRGYNTATSGYTRGVYGRSDSEAGTGVYGEGGHWGVQGRTASYDGIGVYGYATVGIGLGTGVVGRTASKDGTGVLGSASAEGGTAYGIYGWAPSSPSYAGFFYGDVQVQGTLSKSGGSFKIDHPLDPENQTLSHSFVESPDMMNVYNGNVVLDGRGQAWVELPDYFEALNRDYRYQLTCIGGFAPVYIAREIEDNRFQIAGGEPGLEVSWQVTGIRQDAWANANRIPVEEDKAVEDRGYYLNPEVYGQPASKGIHTRQDLE